MARKPIVLIAEDDVNDQMLARRALQKINAPVEVRIVGDGLEAIEYLSGAGKFSDRQEHPTPALIFLDLKMPKKSGFDVLEWIRHDGACKFLPVIVMSSSSLPLDIRRAHELGVNAYFVKPTDFTKLGELLQTATDLFVHKAARVPPAAL
jgi:CheY-like chemotaxis protein